MKTLINSTLIITSELDIEKFIFYIPDINEFNNEKNKI